MRDRDSAKPQTGDRLTEFLAEEEHVEAILLEPDEHRVSLATLGEIDETRLREKLEALLRTLDEKELNSAISTKNGISVKRLPNETLLEKPSCPTAPSLWRWREFAWPEPEEIEETSREEWQALAIQAGICGVALLAAFVFGLSKSIPTWISIAFYIISIIAGAWDAAIDAFGKFKERQLDIHFLMLAVACGAIAIGAWTEGALLLFLFSLSGALEHYALHRTHREINSLTKSAPKQARLILPDGETRSVNVSDLKIGDKLSIRPDEVFPVDAEIVYGQSASDESNLTGESTPVEKSVGDSVYSGTLNMWGAVEIDVVRAATESSLQKIIKLIQEAQHLRAPSQRFTDNFGTRYTYGILAITTIMFFVWWLGFDISPFTNTSEEFSSFYRAMTLLVVASPCALVLSIPSAILAAIAWSARKGILFRGGAAIEKLAEIDTLALDKTGTLTTGELSVFRIESFPEGKEQEIAEIAYTLESNSNHPLARAISAYGKTHGLEQRQLAGFHSLTGKGLRGEVDDKVCYLGRRELVAGGELDQMLDKIPEPSMEFTEVWIVHENLVGRILLKDEIRKESRAVMQEMKNRSIHPLMLTGDRRGAAEKVAKELHVEEVRAGLHPEDKVRAITELSESGRKVAMVGDGVNDAPSLAAAYVSIAMGGKGSDAALEQSDVVLINDRIEKLVTALDISKNANQIIRQNLAISLGTIVIMVGSSLFGIIPLTFGVIAHEGSTVLVCLNSLRLLFSKET